MIVRARQKPVDQLPEWALCCEASRQSHVLSADLIFMAISDRAFKGELECQWCHRITKDLKFVRAVGQRKNLCIEIDLYDFDEGVMA
jgi:hypothetical protein